MSADGRIVSWLSPRGDGYPYDEATAIFARLFRWMGEEKPLAACVRRLEQRLEEDGWLGRDGTSYAFDTALALPLIGDPAPVAQRIVDALSQGWACQPVSRPGWWSQSLGPHLLRCLPPLQDLGYRDFADWMASRLIADCFDGERFHVHAGSAWTYVHGHCYALEGLIGLGGHDDVVLAGARWLALQQQPDGSVPRWVGRKSLDRPTDAVAQAVRIWSLVDRAAFGPSVERGLQWLGLAQQSSGALSYSSSSSDRCSWASAFAMQAAAWAASPPLLWERRLLI
ncbi:MAG: hypothetical protein VX498_12340 [Myxococcota bacterium]|nr:hypothetical protein [Myxococcota bacterium]